MAKAKTRQVVRSEERARRLQEAKTDSWNRTLIIGSIVAIVLVAIAFIAVGWYMTEIRPLGKTVLTVGDIKISLAHLERRMELELDQNSALLQSQGLQLPDIVLADMEREATLLEGAALLDLEVTDEDLAVEISRRGGLAEDVEASEYSAELRRQVDQSGLHFDEYQQMLRADLMEGKVTDYFTFIAPTEEPQVRVRWIVAETQEDADAALARLENGEDFAAIVTDLSIDEATVVAGGEVGWITEGSPQVVPDVDEFAFAAEVGDRSEAISQFNRFYIAEVLETAENRELDDIQRGEVAAREREEWVTTTNATLDVQRNFDEDDGLRALEDIL